MLTEESKPDITGHDLYRAIGHEMIARFQVRSRLLFGFVGLSSTLIAASLSRPDFTFLDIGVGFLALFSGALSAHHEIMIAHLRSYQRILLENANPELSSAWHHFQTEKLLQEWRVSDWTQLFLYLVLGIASLSTTSFPSLGLSGLQWIFFWGSAGCFGLSLVCILYGWTQREKIDWQQTQGVMQR